MARGMQESERQDHTRLCVTKAEDAADAAAAVVTADPSSCCCCTDRRIDSWWFFTLRDRIEGFLFSRVHELDDEPILPSDWGLRS